MTKFYLNQTSKHYLIGIVAMLFILFFFSIFGASLLIKLQGLQKINATTLFISRFIFWGCVALLWIYALKVEHNNLLIWEDRRYRFLEYVKHIFLLLLSIVIIMIPIRLAIHYSGLEQVSDKLVQMSALMKGSKPLVLFVVFTAGITEELIFRGYIQPRLEALFNNPYPAILINSVLFGLLHHGYGTLVNVIGPVVIGLMFSLYYWKFRNIKVLIICHILIDLIALNALLRS